ncbi:hypothetical protein AFLA_009319 [Aspergillus flavus NRRL3357]|nr:hypothetical protein AFLA_009319 [Aspergillus flavus NRRL3357]
MLEEDAEFVTCVRQDCGYGQLHAGGLEDPIVVCGSCGTRTCFIHRHSVWHEGLTCSEYEEYIHHRSGDLEARNEFQTSYQMPSEIYALRHGPEDWSIQVAMSRRTIAETARPCPGCNVATERSGGCKHMTCVLCQQEWCWDCGIRWQRGHLDIEYVDEVTGEVEQSVTLSSSDSACFTAGVKGSHPISSADESFEPGKKWVAGNMLCSVIVDTSTQRGRGEVSRKDIERRIGL